MELKPGSRWKSAVCDTEVVIVRPPKEAASLECGGQRWWPHRREAAGLAISPDHREARHGQAFADETSGAEILCHKGGAGSLSIDGRPSRPRTREAAGLGLSAMHTAPPEMAAEARRTG